LGHQLLNAVDEQGVAATTIKSQQLQPYLQIGKPTGTGFNLAANGSYDFVQHSLQYAGALAVYNWGCCGLSFGYRRYEPGSVGSISSEDSEWLYGFTLANFGTAGPIHSANSPFRNPNLPPAY
jgi:LPS-assembly protein